MMNIHSYKRVLTTAMIVSGVFLVSCSTVNKNSSLVAFLRGDPYPNASSAVATINETAASKEEGAMKQQNASGRPSSASHHRKGRLSKKDEPVKVDAIPSVENTLMMDNKALCSAEDNPRFAFRKRVAVLPMKLDKQIDAIDLPLLSSEYPRELMRRMDKERVISVDATSSSSLSFFDGEHGSGQLISPDKIKSAAKQLGAQFVVSGHFWDVSFDKTRFYPINLVSSLSAWKDLGRKAYQNSTGSYLRQMNIDIRLYDGSTGALIEHKQYQGEAHHHVEANSYRFGSQRFWQSDYGVMASQFLDQQSYMIENALACIPMRAQIVATNKQLLEINAGRDSLLLPGDKLQVFHKMPLSSDWTTDGTRHEKLKHIGSLTITQVYPMRAMARLDAELPKDIILQPGDIVQAW